MEERFMKPWKSVFGLLMMASMCLNCNNSQANADFKSTDERYAAYCTDRAEFQKVVQELYWPNKDECQGDCKVDRKNSLELYYLKRINLDHKRGQLERAVGARIRDFNYQEQEAPEKCCELIPSRFSKQRLDADSNFLLCMPNKE
jgi:hypothetical protein